MSVTVFRGGEDGLSRERWDFNVSSRYSDEISVVLVGYSIERRAQAKGRYRAARREDRWLAFDERPYNSGRPRPTAIPADVLADAVSSIPMRYFIGWSNPDHEVSP